LCTYRQRGGRHETTTTTTSTHRMQRKPLASARTTHVRVPGPGQRTRSSRRPARPCMPPHLCRWTGRPAFASRRRMPVRVRTYTHHQYGSILLP
jgi:hypothetical protein